MEWFPASGLTGSRQQSQDNIQDRVKPFQLNRSFLDVSVMKIGWIS